MPNINRRTWQEYLTCQRVFEVSAVVSGKVIKVSKTISEEYLYKIQTTEFEENIWERLERRLAVEVGKFVLNQPEPTPVSHHKDAIKYAYGVAQVNEKELEHLKETKKAYQEMLLNAIYSDPLKPIKPSKPKYEEKAVSEFEGVEGLDESLWKGTDLA